MYAAAIFPTPSPGPGALFWNLELNRRLGAGDLNFGPKIGIQAWPGPYLIFPTENILLRWDSHNRKIRPFPTDRTTF